MLDPKAPYDAETEAAALELRRAWDEMLARFSEARDAIDNPALFPAPGTPRNLAEGYRYVTGFIYGSIARSIG